MVYFGDFRPEFLANPGRNLVHLKKIASLLGVLALLVTCSPTAASAESGSTPCGWLHVWGPDYAVALGATQKDLANAISMRGRVCVQQAGDLQIPEIQVSVDHKWATGQTDLVVTLKSLSTAEDDPIDPTTPATPTPSTVEFSLHPAIKTGTPWFSQTHPLQAQRDYWVEVTTRFANNAGPGGYRTFVLVSKKASLKPLSPPPSSGGGGCNGTCPNPDGWPYNVTN
ncbi:hypothetical protein ACIBG8_49060 [Nonomuraea sp. NPDC050556]|uniref:hypothetical protein n=1 Tax=Nonomuraea sp. NPDC050556 TaxID=3364369 RepID=UPI00378A0864